MSPAGMDGWMDGCAQSRRVERSVVVADGPAVGRRYLRRIFNYYSVGSVMGPGPNLDIIGVLYILNSLCYAIVMV
ncbi:hypothetical protein BDV36DRAFT_273819 [Aspergillus pseudocaelatus]|uniref:Uncharacterized protein n=1 Tax=Aspergillus pseudocaelatus TaxID=1825620 RepID=A0ABQ6W6B9_9EURO|nr:hypothetical protein BDV36DRAFT_273819 [Aspergillus pseudocaelatus]